MNPHPYTPMETYLLRFSGKEFQQRECVFKTFGVSVRLASEVVRHNAILGSDDVSDENSLC